MRQSLRRMRMPPDDGEDDEAGDGPDKVRRGHEALFSGGWGCRLSMRMGAEAGDGLDKRGGA